MLRSTRRLSAIAAARIAASLMLSLLRLLTRSGSNGGVGGSLLSVGAAAGVALMGQSKGLYTFFGHLKWSWAIALGYMASILCHMLLADML